MVIPRKIFFYDFIETKFIFNGFYEIYLDEGNQTDKIRYTTVGDTGSAIIHITWTEPSEDIIRIISVRKATKKVRKKIFMAIVTYTEEEVEEMLTRGKSQTDCNYIKKMTDEEADQKALNDPNCHPTDFSKAIYLGYRMNGDKTIIKGDPNDLILKSDNK
jgi:uncharacterized DUF497 family protein